MKIPTLSVLKKEMSNLPQSELIEVLTTLAKYSKENKELLNYLLFEADFESNYIEKIKAELDEQFEAVKITSPHLLKKQLQKIARILKKNIKYSGIKQTEIELLIHFCLNMMKINVHFHRYTVLLNLIIRQFNRIQKVIESLDDDLQSDYKGEVELIREYIGEEAY
jgi:hypothetical protein